MALKFLLPGQMQYMSQHGFDVTMISADGIERNDVIQNEGCPHLIVPMTRQITPLKDLQCLWQLIKIFKKIEPDIVHTHTPKAGLLGMLAAKICRVKIRIHTVAGLPLMVERGFKFQLLKLVEKITYWGANHVWPNSYSLLKYIKQQRLTSQKKLKVISKGSSNGINLQRFNKANFSDGIFEEIKKSIDYNNNTQYLLTIGRLVKDKGIIELVQAFKNINTHYKNLKLILVGKYEAELDALPEYIINEIENNPNIIHINWSNHVEYYMALATIFVFPSHREGFPNVLLQAGALGTPIICTAIAGNVDIIKNNKTGILCAVSNEVDLQHKINFALQNIALLQAMAATLKTHIHTFYSRDIVWQAILNEYETLLNPTK